STSRASHRTDSTPQYGRRLLHCGISVQPMSRWVRSGLLTTSATRPLLHRKRKSIRDLAMSHKCQELTHASAANRIHSITPSAVETSAAPPLPGMTSIVSLFVREQFEQCPIPLCLFMALGTAAGAGGALPTGCAALGTPFLRRR